MKTIYFILLCLGLALLGCTPMFGERKGLTHEEEFIHALNQVHSWIDLRDIDYPKADWLILLQLAREIQSAKKSRVVEIFQDVQKRSSSDARMADAVDSKLYILMRLPFDLPENSKDQAMRFGSWVRPIKEFNNKSWPVGWLNGFPFLRSGYLGVQGIGGRYNAATEYKYLREHYPYRTLPKPIEPEVLEKSVLRN